MIVLQSGGDYAAKFLTLCSLVILFWMHPQFGICYVEQLIREI